MLCLRLISFVAVAPEEPYDGRSLYERLKEQKGKWISECQIKIKFWKSLLTYLRAVNWCCPMCSNVFVDAKQEEFEESRKFKNMIRGLDDDDVDHLHEVDSRKVQQERLQKEEELKELNDYRTRVQELQEQSADQVDSRKYQKLFFNYIKTLLTSRNWFYLPLPNRSQKIPHNLEHYHKSQFFHLLSSENLKLKLKNSQRRKKLCRSTSQVLWSVLQSFLV